MSSIPISIDAELDALFGQYTASGQAKGLVYGRVTASGLAHATGFGTCNDDGLEPDADTVFPIASMSKSFTACAALVARDRGLLSLEDPISTYVPEYAAWDAEEPYDPPTVGMLLSMSGGLTEDDSWIDPFLDTSVEQVLAYVRRGLNYSHFPGAVYEYSNLGFALAGLAVARAAGRSIEDFVRDELIEPLGLASTFFDNAAPDGIARATGYSLDTKGIWTRYPHTTSVAFAATGGIMSTVRDLATWMTWLGSAFRPRTTDDLGVVSRASRREMQRMRIVDKPALSLTPEGALRPRIRGYGLGLQISQDLHRGTFVAHGGGLPGFSLYMLWHPDSGNGTVVLTNSHGGNPSALCVTALGRVLASENAPAETILLWPETVASRSAADRLVRHWDDSLAAEIFAGNIAFDRPLIERRAEIEELVAEVGPLHEPRPAGDIVSAATPADVTWSIPGENGELICMIHLTPVKPAKIQEFVVKARRAGTPRSAAPADISPQRAELGDAKLSPLANTRVTLP